MHHSTPWIRRRHRRVLRGLRVVFAIQLVFSVGVPLVLDLLNQQSPNLLTTISGLVVGLLLLPQARTLLKWLYLPTLLVIDAVHITALLWYTEIEHLGRGSLWALGYIPILIAAGRWWSYAGGAWTLAVMLLADAGVLFSRLPWRTATAIFVFQAVTAALGAWAAALTEARTRRDLLQREAHALSEERLQRAQTLLESTMNRLNSLGVHAQALDADVRLDAVAAEQQLALLQRDIHTTVHELQRAFRTFGPSPLLQRTLPEAIAQQLKSLQQTHMITPHFRCEAHLPDLSPGVADFLFQATQELLHNVGYHADASEVTVDLHGDLIAHSITLEIADDGPGVAETTIQEGQALERLQQHAQSLGGDLKLNANPTRICIHLPTHPPVPELEYDH